MRILVSPAILAFLGVVAASSIQTGGWKPEQEFIFKYTTQVLTGIPELNDQFSGIRLSSDVRVQSLSDSSLRIRLENTKFNLHNDQLQQENLQDFGNHLEQNLPSEMKKWLETSFTVYHKRGHFEKMEIQNSEPEFIVNLKKGLMSHLQFQLRDSSLSRARAVSKNHVQSKDQAPTFKVMEESILGYCETSYSINPLPLDLQNIIKQEEQHGSEVSCQDLEFFEVIKSRNLDNCLKQPVYHKTFGTWSRSEGAGSSSQPSHSSVSRAIMCGTIDDYRMVKVTSQNKVISSALGDKASSEILELTSTSILHLQSVKDISDKIETSSSIKTYTTLSYEYGKGYLSGEPLSGVRNGSLIFADQPDMTSAPEHLLPRSIPVVEVKEKVIQSILDLVRDGKKINQNLEKDIAGVSTVISRSIHILGYAELRDVESTLRREQDSKLLIEIFYDLLAITGTNPCIKLIKERVIDGEISGETGSWVISNALRLIKYPTEELLQELVELLLTRQVQDSRPIQSSLVLGLTEIVYKACINPVSSRNEFPTKIYGQFCNKNSKVIKDQLEPFLVNKMRESRNRNKHSALVYVNALGNLGTETAGQELVNVVEGRFGSSPLIRSLAVYRLIRNAKGNPALYKTIFQALIENPSENTEVRIAAITAFPYSQPSTSDYQRLAIRTWFEQTQQVSSYIYSTLKGLKNSLTGPNEFSRKATIALTLCKPSTYGIQTSRNVQVSQFIESFKSIIHQNIQWVSSKESFIPKSIYSRMEMRGITNSAVPLEAHLYIHGAQYVIDQLYEMYSGRFERQDTTQEQNNNFRELRERSSKLQVEPRFVENNPEVHFTLKSLGLQKIYSLDTEFVRTIKEDLESLLRNRHDLTNGISKEYFKVHDWSGSDTVFPTESGFPAYITRRNPSVLYTRINIDPKATVSFPSNMEFNFDLKTILNYKQEVQGGILTPITDQAHAAGADFSVFASLPLKGKVSLLEGQASLTVLKTNDTEDKLILQSSVTPFTTSCTINKIRPAIKSSSSKFVKSRTQEKEESYNLLRPLGLNLKVQIQTEKESVGPFPFAPKKSSPFWISSLFSSPFNSAKRQLIRLEGNPSEVEAVTFNVNIGFGTKETEHEKSHMSYPRFKFASEVERVCKKNAQEENEILSCKEFILHKLGGEIIDFNILRSNIGEKLMNQQSQEVAVEKQICREGKNWCDENRQSEMNICSENLMLCTQRRENRDTTRETLKHLKTGNAVTVSLSATLRESQDLQRFNTHISLGHKRSNYTEEIQMRGEFIQESPSFRQPFEVKYLYSRIIQKPKHYWDSNEVLNEDLTGKIVLNSQYGYQGEEKDQINVDFDLGRSESLKHFAQNSEEVKQCEKDLGEGRSLTTVCKQAKRQADSSDIISGTLSIPRKLSQTQMYISLVKGVKSFLFPFISEKQVDQVESNDRIDYKVEGSISNSGEEATLKLKGNNVETELKGINLGSLTKGLYPVSTKHSILNDFFQKMTNYASPSSCRIEGGKVTSFDQLEYEYELNNCEHIVFQDCSEDQRVSVSTKRRLSKQQVTIFVDGNKYEVETDKPDRYLRSGKTILRVNGEEMVWRRQDEAEGKFQSENENRQVNTNEISRSQQRNDLHYIDGEENYLNNGLDCITNFKDGVVKFTSLKYGVTVLVDHERIEILSYQHLFRNTACGLCGDLNGEKSADMKSSKMCLMSKPKLAGFSYMIEDGNCQGIPTEHRTRFNKEQSICEKISEIPTKISQLLRYNQMQNKKTNPYL